ncbi:MAG: hypothetical protein AABW73_03940 [Nanoarchaeota archaeon]
MRVISFGLTKQFAEKLSEPNANFNVSNGINIKDIQQIKVDFIKDEEALNFSFEFRISYDKDIAKISFNGNILVALDKKSAADILKRWNDKKIPDLVRVPLFNFIMARCTVKAMQFEEDFNLPKHIQIPQFRGQVDEAVVSSNQPSASQTPNSNKQNNNQNSNKQNNGQSQNKQSSNQNPNKHNNNPNKQQKK